MEHSTENLEHYSASQSEKNEEKTPYTKRPVMHRVLSWLLIAMVLFGFLGTCYWLVMFGRG